MLGGVEKPQGTQEGCVDFVFSPHSFPWAKVTELCLHLLKHPTPSAEFFVNKPEFPLPCTMAPSQFPSLLQFSPIISLGNNMRKLCCFTPSDLISLDACQVLGINHT